MADRGGSDARLLLIFDGDCGFCSLCVLWIQALDRRGRVRVEPFQRSRLLQEIGLTRAQCEEAAWAIEPDGRRHRGALAVCAALAWAVGVPAWCRICALPGLRQLLEAVYRWVAAHRDRLPGVCPYCQRYPEACGRTSG